MTAEYTTVQVEKAAAKNLRKAAIDAEQDIRDIATRAIQKGLPLVRDEIRSSQRNNTITPQQTPALNKA
jgi:hypothetical protein